MSSSDQSPDQPGSDQSPDQPGSDQPGAPQPGSPRPGDGEVARPVSAILDDCFWERRRRNTAVPIAVGVLGLTAIGLIQILPARHAVEQDLASRSTQALHDAGVNDVDVRFSGRDGTLTGTVTSPAQRDSAVNAVRHVAGVRIAHDRLAGPGRSGSGSTPGNVRPTAPSAARTAPQVTAVLRDHRLTLSGSVPSGSVRANLVAEVRAAVHPDRISNRISVDRQRSSAGLDGLAGVLRALGPDAVVTVELRGGRLTLTGGVASPRQIREAVAAGARVAGDPRRVVNRLTVDQRVTVAAALRALPPVTFRTAYSTPTEQDEMVVRRLAGVLAANPTVRLEVLGYTDDVGDSDMNYGLSYARARIVYRELQRLGVPKSRLSFQSFGEKYPKEPNTSAANRAANRRVEFRLLPS
jgi:outer membrane protein OmpA-like peptidoglycan-associated protein